MLYFLILTFSQLIIPALGNGGRKGIPANSRPSWAMWGRVTKKKVELEKGVLNGTIQVSHALHHHIDQTSPTACIVRPSWPDVTQCLHFATKLTRHHPLHFFVQLVCHQNGSIWALCSATCWDNEFKEREMRGVCEYTVVEDKSLHSNFRINCEATLQWPDYRSL